MVSGASDEVPEKAELVGVLDTGIDAEQQRENKGITKQGNQGLEEVGLGNCCKVAHGTCSRKKDRNH